MQPPADVAKDPNYRQVVISVQSQKVPLPKLTAKDLRLYQANQQLQIAFFQPQPAAVAILVDNSGSMEIKLPACKSALEAFINDLNPSDEISLFVFSDRVGVLSKPTTDHASVINALSAFHAWGQTALYDSVNKGLEVLSQSCAKTKALLLITDGMDTASSSTLEQTKEIAQKEKVPIYLIGIGDRKTVGNNNPPFFMSPISNPMGNPTDDRVDVTALQLLAQDSNAQTFLVDLRDNGEALKRATTAIADKIGNQYLVGFIGDGSTSQLRFEAPQHKEVSFREISAD